MSADNYTECPKCRLNAERDRRLLEDRIKKSYGVVSAQEYHRMEKELENPIKPTGVLREDYSIGINTGVFKVDYIGTCAECGFSFKFSEKKDILELQQLRQSNLFMKSVDNSIRHLHK